MVAVRYCGGGGVTEWILWRWWVATWRDSVLQRTALESSWEENDVRKLYLGKQIRPRGILSCTNSCTNRRRWRSSRKRCNCFLPSRTRPSLKSLVSCAWKSTVIKNNVAAVSPIKIIFFVCLLFFFLPVTFKLPPAAKKILFGQSQECIFGSPPKFLPAIVNEWYWRGKPEGSTHSPTKKPLLTFSFFCFCFWSSLMFSTQITK